MFQLRYRKPIKKRPKKIRDGEMFCAMPLRLAQRKAEEVLIVSFIVDRKLFGLGYECLQPDYFWEMPADSGVFVCPLVRTRDLFPRAERPGDIDLLVVPYEGNELVLDRVLAIEVKAIRAKFSHPGKSPNEFGFSQANALLDLGFPYVAVAHLIVSDISPEEHWREMMTARIIDSSGRAELLAPTRIDPLADTLTSRSFGRLLKNCYFGQIGLVSAYIFSSIFDNVDPTQHMIHFPEGRRASFNPKTNLMALDAVASFFNENAERFLDTPKFPPKD